MPSASPDDANQSGASSSQPSTKPFSLSLGSKPTKSVSTSFKSSSRPPSTGRPPSSRKRPHSSLHESDDEGEDGAPQPQLISGFDREAGGAIELAGKSQASAKPKLVIEGPKNRDFREEARRKRGRKNLLPAEVQAMRNGNGRVGTTESINDSAPAYGLTFVGKAVEEGEDTRDVGGQEEQDKVGAEQPRDKSEDEVAIQALLGNSDAARKSNLVLQSTEQKREEEAEYEDYVDEDEAFRRDVASRPDAATLADYAAVPVEEFGAALLRGMGWKEGDAVGRRKDAIVKARVLEKRPAHLGLGAKPDEFGMVGKAAKDMQRDKDSRSRKTGGDYHRSSDRDRYAHRDSYREHRDRRDRYREERDSYRDSRSRR